MMIGMPTNAIVEAIGRGCPDNCETRSAPTPITLPESSERGMTILCEELLLMALAICGATIPTNPSGPQNAVTAPVIIEQLNRAENRMRPV